MRIVFRMDPLAEVVVGENSTYELMLAARRHGHEIFHMAGGAALIDSGTIRLHLTPVDLEPGATSPWRLGAPRWIEGENIDLVLIRTDPPFDDRYLRDTWLLEHLPPSTAVVNTPAGLRTVAEKLWCLRFADLMPPTLVAREFRDFKAWFVDQGTRDIILKPVDGHAGRGVFRVNAQDRNAYVAWTQLTDNGHHEAIAQHALAGDRGGEKRVLTLGDRVLGVVPRIARGCDHRNHWPDDNPDRAMLSANEQAVVERILPALQAAGIFCAGLDLIDGYLTEINVTSPGMLQDLAQISGRPIADEVLTACLEQVATSRLQLTDTD